MDIVHYLQVNGDQEKIYQVISTPRGISKWWSLDASGHSELGAVLDLDFGPGYQWQAQVIEMVPPVEYTLLLIRADPDWINTTVGFHLEQSDGAVNVRFHHKGWDQASEHYYISCYCWAMYLRLMKRYVEHGEVVDYDQRLSV